MIKLTGVTQNDLLLRLNEKERRPFVCSSSSEGWTPILAWEPSAVLAIKEHDQDHANQIQDFVSHQQQINRLVTGYLSYEYGCLLHKMAPRGIDKLEVPLVYMMSFNNWIQFENDYALVYASDQRYIDEVNAILKRPKKTVGQGTPIVEPIPTISRQDYSASFKSIKNYIKEGDVYQVNLTHRLEGKTIETGRDLFFQISTKTQAGFQAYIEDPEFEILSFSPERFVSIKNGLIKTEPIKGTRPRGKTKAEDNDLADDLKNNPKDLAELNMITDLMRNDLGKICLPGTVKVTQKRIIKSYPTLWHANSIISGELDPNTHPITALASISPGGSVTGCPKKRALEIIDELEPNNRNIYTGSIFVLQPNGDLDSNIAIRTILKLDKRLLLSVGGGIVYDSIENEEYNESLDKARFIQS